MIVVALVSGAVYAAPRAESKDASKPAVAAKSDAKADTKPEAKPKEGKDKAAGLSVKLEKKGSYIYWFSYKDADGVEQTTLPERFKGKSADLDESAMGDKFTGAKLYVMDRASGNMAVADYPPKGSQTINFKSDDLQYVRTVRLRVIAADKKPVESAIVTITDGMNNEIKAVVTPADEGVATFNNVASGEVTVQVEADGLRKTLDSDIEIPDKRKTPDYEQDIRVAGDVHTVAVTHPTAAAAAAQPTPRDNAIGMLETLAVILFIIVAGAVIVLVLRQRGLNAQIALRKLGVDLPGDQAGMPGMPGAPGAAPQGPAIDPTVCEFCGQKKDAAGRCACSVTPGASPFGAAPAASSNGTPRLVGSQGVYSGHIFEITTGAAVIGREAGNDVSLPNDSTASRRHATITRINGEYSIRDEGSSNGTFVNGAKISEQTLRPGDEIQVGGTKFRFEIY